MFRKITAKDYAQKLEYECRKDIDSFVIEADGTMYRKGKTINLLPGPTACELALRHAAAYKLTGDSEFLVFTAACLNAAQAGLVEHKGHLFWANEITPSLCAQGRWIRNAYYAATAIDDQRALSWLADMMDRWPYLPEEHRFVERVLAGPQKATSEGGFSHTYNMLSEGAVDGWMLGKATGNHALMDRCEDEIIHFILPGQRADGHWDYRARSASMSANDSCAPEEYNYSLYNTVILSNLLQFEEWRDRLLGPLQKSYSALRSSFEFADGGIYAPVHWGWGHAFESPLFSMIVAWRLYKYGGFSEYAAVAARALHWKETAQFHSGLSPLFWDRHFLELLLDDFAVEADVADVGKITETLQDLERKMSTPLPSQMQYDRHPQFILRHTFSLQRRIQHLINEERRIIPSRLEVPVHPEKSEVVSVSWYKEPYILNNRSSFAWDDDFFYADFQVANNNHWQPYEGSDLFRGDGVILFFHDQELVDEVRINLALTTNGPMLFQYNPQIPFGPYRSWLPRNSELGNILKLSQLSAIIDEKAVHYSAKLSWQELGIDIAARKTLLFSYTVTKLRPEGYQHLTWGKDPFDSISSAHPASLVLV